MASLAWTAPAGRLIRRRSTYMSHEPGRADNLGGFADCANEVGLLRRSGINNSTGELIPKFG